MKKIMMVTWSESEESFEEEREKEVANMCFMAIDELDEVNSNFSDEDIHDVFEELYEKLSLKNNSLKKKIQELEKVKEKFSLVEISKTHLEKENEILRSENEVL